MTITERIFELLKTQDKTQLSLANAVGTTKSTMHYTFSNNNAIPAEWIIPAARFLDVSVNYLLTGEPDPIEPIVNDEPKEPTLPEDAKELINVYSELDHQGKTTVLYFAYQERTRCRKDQEEKNSAKSTA